VIEPGDTLDHPLHGEGRVWDVDALTLEAVVIYDLGAGLPLDERFVAKRLPVAWCIVPPDDLEPPTPPAPSPLYVVRAA
jgi:hypothetical protein